MLTSLYVIAFLSQDVVLMCQTLEKVFNQKLATMPAEVRVMECLATSDRIKKVKNKNCPWMQEKWIYQKCVSEQLSNRNTKVDCRVVSCIFLIYSSSQCVTMLFQNSAKIVLVCNSDHCFFDNARSRLCSTNYLPKMTNN